MYVFYIFRTRVHPCSLLETIFKSCKNTSQTDLTDDYLIVSFLLNKFYCLGYLEFRIQKFRNTIKSSILPIIYVYMWVVYKDI